MQLPERDKLSMSLEQMTSRLAIMMGGRVAEELVFGREKVTSGASSDIEQATRLARMMVTRWGLSEELGTVSYGENQDEVFLGMSVSRTQNASEATVQKIDTEIRRLVEEGYNEATRILTEKRADLEALAKGLLEFETLSGDEIQRSAQGQEAEPRVGAGADHAARFGRAAGRQAAPASRSGCRPGAAAAGVSVTCPCRRVIPAHRSCKARHQAGLAFLWRGASADCASIAGKLPDGSRSCPRLTGAIDMVHLFAANAKGLGDKPRRYRAAIEPDGMVWVSWPKKSSGVATDLTRMCSGTPHCRWAWSISRSARSTRRGPD